MTPNKDQAVRVCRLHSLEYGDRELRPGESVRIGRHPENDLVMDSTMVSRFHSRITWDRQVERPLIFDNGSQNGTIVDGNAVRTAESLRDGSRIAIGPFVIRVELLGVGDTPAILKDTNDLVTLFSEAGPDVKGELKPDLTVRQLMQSLESERRTGTLSLDLPAGKGKVTFCLGRLMSAELNPGGKALRALEMIMRATRGEFRLTRELEPQEDALNLWVSDFLRTRSMDPADATQRFRATQRRPRSL